MLFLSSSKTAFKYKIASKLIFSWIRETPPATDAVYMLQIPCVRVKTLVL